MRWLSLIGLLPWLLWAQSVAVMLAWDIVSEHDDPAIVWEVEANGQVLPCGPATLTATDRRCEIMLPAGPTTLRLRAERGVDTSEWSAAIVAQLDEGGTPGEFVVTWHEESSAMASFTVDAEFGEDVDSGGNEFPGDGDDWCGGGGGASYRVANRFDISELPVDATVNQVDFEITVLSVVSASALLWDIDGYNGTGQGDPEADSGATAYAACAITGVYINDTTQFRTTGTKTFTDLGATANADVEAARDAGSTFVVAIRETTDTTANELAKFDEYIGANPPRLTITYTAAGGPEQDSPAKIHVPQSARW